MNRRKSPQGHLNLRLIAVNSLALAAFCQILAQEQFETPARLHAIKAWLIS
ncbi:MAG: hypothetical protein R3186_05210 [Ruegeria sp.]|nr:hypothetical protein [Ruegeria sp.]